MNIQTIVGDNIRGFRHKLDITQEKLSIIVDLHINYISSVERGERNIGIQNIVKIAKAFKIKPYVLMYENAYKLPKEDLQVLNTFGKK